VDIMTFGAIRFMPFISLLLVSTAPGIAGGTVHLSIDASKAGAKIDRNLFGQFAENLGHGLYEGIWVGPDSPIPNTHGIRNDVVSALRALKVPTSAGRAAASATSIIGAKESAPPRSDRQR
jgi:alpha-N-arabinofuranosidase